MSTDTTWQIKSGSSEVTEQLAEQLGRTLKGGEVIELVSDLGGGKTTFVRGLARGAGTKDVVSSPTFTISKVYDCRHFAIHHFDFYRLSEPGLMSDELAEVVGDPAIVTVIEWGDSVQQVLPPDKITVNIRRLSDTEREITIVYPKERDYLAEALQN